MLFRSTRPFTGRWRNAALRVYGWARRRLPIAASYVFVFVGRRAPLDAPTLVRPSRDEVVPGGWHAPEESSRWTKGDAALWLRLGSTVAADLLHDEPDGPPLAVTFRADGTVLGTVTLPPRTWTEVSVDVPAALRGRVARLVIAPARTWSDRKSTRLNSSHIQKSRMPSSA